MFNENKQIFMIIYAITFKSRARLYIDSLNLTWEG